MSEQFAIQPEEFDSTNERLDSILDRLNSLGQAASEMKTAPLRSLQSVPDLEDGDLSSDSGAAEAPDLVPPAIPQLGLVPPAIPTQQQEAADTSNAVFASLDTVDVGDDFESVTAVEADLEPEFELDDEVELAPFDLDASEDGWVSTDNEASELDLANPATDEDLERAEAASSVAIAAEADEIAQFEETPVDEVVMPESPALDVPAVESLFPEVAVEPAAEPVLPEPVEGEALDTEITAPSPLFYDQAATETVEPVALEPERPSAPASIFNSSLKRADSPVVQRPAETDGWISHSPTPEAVPAESIAPPVTDAIFDQDGREDIAVVDDIAAQENIPVQRDALVTEPAPAQPDATMMANEVEESLVQIEALDAADPFSPTATHAPIAIEGLGSPLSDHVPSSFASLEAEPPELYDSDEELPLPDFTGVYDESPEASEAAAPAPRFARASARDKELDKLRPEDHDSGDLEAKTQSEEREGWTPLLQLIFVIGFGVAVLVFFWVQDPAAVEDIRSELDALLGRN